MTDPASTREGEDGRVRIGRRRFLGTSLAAAGAALSASTGAALAGSSRAAAQDGSRRQSAPSAEGEISQLDLRETFPHLPAVPFDPAGMSETLANLEVRSEQTTQARQGLTQRFTLDGVTRPAYAFLFEGATHPTESEEWQDLKGSLREDPETVRRDLHENLGRRRDAAASARGLSLERPRQFSISWTSFPNVQESGRPLLPTWAASLSDAETATRQFWPMIARHGLGYNLIIPERVTRGRAGPLRRQFGAAWTRAVRAALASGNLYVIDMSRFEMLQPQSVNGAPRFTPSTVTLLIRNPRTRSLTPVAIIVSGHGGRARRVYTRARATEGAWLYALQAAKASITLYGVWLGHVYHWHLVTAAMQMTMLNTLPGGHPIRRLLAPQSKYAIPFDNVLLHLWAQIAPPTSLATANDFLALANDYADGRSYFDDDPWATINELGLRRRDFSARSPWDRYPVVQRLTTLWDLVASYVDTFVGTTYGSDATVVDDRDLQAWIATASSSNPRTGGNIRGLPEMSTRVALRRVLTSLLYRTTAHGVSRLNSSSNPALTFVANFPHCLQRTDIPGPRTQVPTRSLLTYLPNTDTISQSVTFYFTFAFSTPYEPFIPFEGVGSELFFPGGRGDSRNRALIDLRRGLARFIDDYQPEMPQLYQWPLNIET